MKKTIWTLTVIFLISLVPVLAYHNLILFRGESVPNDINPRFTCDATRCYLCVDDDLYPTRPSYCTGLPYETLEGTVVDENPPVITVNAPFEGQLFNSRYINFDIHINEYGKLYYMNMDAPERGYYPLCINCEDYHGKKRFNEGLNTIKIKAKDYFDNEAYSGEISFRIDTKKPKIKDTMPDDESYVSGTGFSVYYDEENVQEILLHYGVNVEDNVIPLAGCESGTSMLCSIDLDLSEFNGQTISYYFSISDGINLVSSKIYTLNVDTEPPVVNLIEPQGSYNDKKRNILVELSEEVEELEYALDEDILAGKFLTLCRKCDGYNKTRVFKDGEHAISVRATDYAGHQVADTETFKLDTKPPKAKKTEPKKNSYADGAFSIIYEEENPLVVSLTYGLGGLTTTIPVPGCLPGKNTECKIENVDLNAFDGKIIEYYFTLNDGTFETTSKPVKVSVDITPPEILSWSSPEEGGIYDDKYQYIKMEFSEEVDAEYKINDGEFKLLGSDREAINTRKTFEYGANSLTVKITDKAGNTISETRNFYIEEDS